MDGTTEENIGVYICHCGFNIGGVIDIKRIVDEFSDGNRHPHITIIEHKYLCSDAGVLELKKHIKENQISRVVIAACTMKLHGEFFSKAIEETGLNRFLVEFANIREQNSWVHGQYPEKATAKAIDQINMALEKVRLAKALETIKSPVEQSCLIIGGGVAGIKAALAVADAGFKTYLVERQPTIGGHMALFDKTFPTLDCSICVLGPEMVKVKDHKNIELLTYSEVVKVTGFSGQFQVQVKKKARYVDEHKCAGCFNDCCDVCPVEINDKFYPRHAIFVPYPQAVPLVPVIDMDHCIHCRACELGCQRDAIAFSQQDTIRKITTGTIIVASGFEAFDPTVLRELGYGYFPNVITGMEMERLLNPYGPTKGLVVKPSDGTKPREIAFILWWTVRLQMMSI